MPTGQALLDQMNSMPILPNSLALWGLGQMGLAIKGPDGILYFDPCLSDVVRHQFGDWWYRAFDPPLLPEQVTNADYIFSSHEHIDHLDAETLGPAAKASPDAQFVITGWSRQLIADMDIPDERVIVPKLGATVTLPGTSARLTTTQSAHYDTAIDPVKGPRWHGYLIEWNGVTFYHGGDNIIYPGYIEMMRGLPTPDVAMIAVNGRDWFRDQKDITGNLWPHEAARLASELGWGTVIIGHNDLYPNNTIPAGSIAEGFHQYGPRVPYHLLQPGELYYVVR